MMGRKPFLLEQIGGKGNRQRVWEAIRARGGAEWTRAEIAVASHVADEAIATYLGGLAAAQIIRQSRSEPGRGVAIQRWYVLVRDTGLEAPRVRRDGTPVTQGLSQEQMWRSLRMLKGDLMEVAGAV